MKNPRTILITGATSGIGAALAKEYAGENVNLFLTGRNKIRLKEVANKCESKGAWVSCEIIDIKDTNLISSWTQKCDKQKPIDLVIANAGISAGTGGGGESWNQVKNIFATNLDGLLATICPIIPNMIERGKGQIVIMSSLAGIRGLPSSPAYSGSKAAVRVYGEGLRGNLSKHNIGVTVITPGYVKTPMTDVNKFPMPFLVNLDKATNIIISKLKKNPALISFPKPFYFIVLLMSILPACITDPIFSRLPGKQNLSEK